MQDIQFNKDVGDMDGTEARATLRDLRSKYSEARDEYESLQEENQEYSEKLEAAKEDAEAAREFFAEFAAEESGLDKETILDKFSDADEIRSEFLSDAEFQLVGAEGDTETEEEDENKFEDKPERSDNLPGDDDSSEYSDRASSVISQLTVQRE